MFKLPLDFAPGMNRAFPDYPRHLRATQNTRCKQSQTLSHPQYHAHSLTSRSMMGQVLGKGLRLALLRVVTLMVSCSTGHSIMTIFPLVKQLALTRMNLIHCLAPKAFFAGQGVKLALRKQFLASFFGYKASKLETNTLL